MTKRGDPRRSLKRRFPSYRQPSPRGEGAPKGRIGHRRHEREREGASQVDDLRKHPSAADAVPLPRWGRLRRSDAPRQFLQRTMPESGGDSDTGKRISNIRGSQPRLATLDSPFQRKGRECGAFRVYRSLLPLEGGGRRAERRFASIFIKGDARKWDSSPQPLVPSY